MKLYFILLISILTVSCQDNSNLEMRIGQLEAENTVLKDSIQHLTRNLNPIYLVDTLGIDTSMGPLGNLHSDTLILYAEFAECGEFGGQREWLKIFRNRDTTYCLNIRDSADCDNYDYTTRFTRIDSTIYSLDRNDEIAIMNYLNELTKLTFMEQQPNTNAMNYYSAKVASSNHVYSRLRFETSAIDWSFLWPNFIRLRTELELKKATYHAWIVLTES